MSSSTLIGALAADLHRLGTPLVLRRDKRVAVVAAFAAEFEAGAMYCMRHVEPFWNAVEQALESRLHVRLPDDFADPDLARVPRQLNTAVLSTDGLGVAAPAEFRRGLLQMVVAQSVRPGDLRNSARRVPLYTSAGGSRSWKKAASTASLRGPISRLRNRVSLGVRERVGQRPPGGNGAQTDLIGVEAIAAHEGLCYWIAQDFTEPWLAS
jgi:DNA photolyase